MPACRGGFQVVVWCVVWLPYLVSCERARLLREQIRLQGDDLIREAVRVRSRSLTHRPLVVEQEVVALRAHIRPVRFLLRFLQQALQRRRRHAPAKGRGN